ncbi:MAG: LysR family transcriptional regulator [Burkholderiaceae bacterium]|nr:LysR family transcriptional regulator [Burkholderiaceae bacterium]
MDHFQAIRVFARIVETGAFGRAAESLQMPNATVSKSIQMLEQHLGVRLLERNTRRVGVTADGAAYYERTRHLMSELEDIEATLGRSQRSPRGSLRVDTGGSTASAVIIPALPDFRSRYPDIQVQLSVTDRTLDLVGENIDCAIRSVADDPALVTKRLGSLRWTTCASPEFLRRHGVPKHPTDISKKEFPVAGYFSARTGLVQPLRFLDQGELIEVPATNSVLVNESNAHLAAGLVGLGLIHTMDFNVRPWIERGELRPVLESYRPTPLEVYIVYPPSRRLSTKVRVFVEWVSSIYAAMDGE